MGFNSKPPKILSGTEAELAELTRYLSDLHAHLNGGQSLTGSLSTKKVSVTFRLAAQEQPVEHGLGRIPDGFTVVDAKTAAIITRTTREPSTSRYFLQSDTPGVTVSVLFF